MLMAGHSNFRNTTCIWVKKLSFVYVEYKIEKTATAQEVGIIP
jgi:hypothetical protein